MRDASHKVHLAPANTERLPVGRAIAVRAHSAQDHEHVLDAGFPPMPIEDPDGELAVLVRCAECGVGGRVSIDVHDVDWGEWR